MFKNKIVKFFICIIVTIVVSACSKPETLSDMATNMVNNDNYEDEPAQKTVQKENVIPEEPQPSKPLIVDNSQTFDTLESPGETSSPKKRGFLSWIFGMFGGNKKSDVPSDSNNVIVNNTSTQSSIISDNTTNRVIDLDSPTIPQDKKESFFKNVFAKVNKDNNDSNEVHNVPYKEDSFSTQKNLSMVVLRIPKSDNLEIKETKPNEKFLETKNTVKENIKNKEDLYAGFNILSYSDPQTMLNTTDNNIEEQYLDYIISLKYEGVISNYNNLNPNVSLTSQHKKLINQLVQKDYNKPKILYIIYRNINTIKDNSSVKNQLYLTSYLNVIRAYIYSKKINNIFVQEVQYKTLPVNEVLLVTKPISFNEFQDLPKQVNIYNAPKTTSKAWLEKIKLLEQKAKEKQKKLYQQAEGK